MKITEFTISIDADEADCSKAAFSECALFAF